MALHCVCRLGFFDLLYQQRHTLSYAIGLIEEIPIAMCSGDYDFTKGLVIEVKQEDSCIPKKMTHAEEINLFFSSSSTPLPHQSAITLKLIFPLEEKELIHRDFTSVFHPPTRG